MKHCEPTQNLRQRANMELMSMSTGSQPTPSGCRRGRGRTNKPLMIDTSNSSSSEEEAEAEKEMCPVCAEPVEDRENSRICMKCLKSVHIGCSDDAVFFVCINCEGSAEPEQSHKQMET